MIGGSLASISMIRLSIPQPLEGAEDMLDRVELGVSDLDSRGAYEVSDVVNRVV